MNSEFNAIDFDELMDQALRLPDGDAKLALLEQAVRVADTRKDIEQGFKAREEMVDLFTFKGYPLKALVAFSWLVGMKDKYPELLSGYSLLWKYMYISGHITCFPEVNRIQIENLLEDMKLRFAAEGYSDRTYYYYKMIVSIRMGDLDEGIEYYKLVQTMERDEMSNCQACEQASHIGVQAILGNDEGILHAAEPILAEKLKCDVSLETTIPLVLMTLLRLGLKEEADEWQRKGYELIKGRRDYLFQLGLHISYLTYTDPIKALEVFEENVVHSLNQEDPEIIMYFSAFASKLFSRIEQENIQFDVRLPLEHPCLHLSRNVAQLGKYYKNTALDYAYKYDQRNGNDYRSNEILELCQFSELK